jgi:hypothetical protein
MPRSGWIIVALLLATGLLGALLLGHALSTTNGTARPKDVPVGAVVLRKLALPAKAGIPEQRVVTWQLGGKPEEAGSGFYGVSIWEGRRQLYAHRAPKGAVNLSVETGDFTGDGHDDVLVFDDLGRGICVYRALTTGAGSVRQVNAGHLCDSDGSIHLRDRGLLISVPSKKCCHIYVRRTLKRWKGGRLVTVSSKLERVPPGGTLPGIHTGGPG